MDNVRLYFFYKPRLNPAWNSSATNKGTSTRQEIIGREIFRQRQAKVSRRNTEAI